MKTLKARPTAHFKEGSGPESDGGSHSIYWCGHCKDKFFGGNGVVMLPNKAKDLVVQCPYCGCVDPSWKNKFRYWGLIAREER